ncbi:MAG: sigma-70 family RNA polymerase sigma factor [Patescibacteria group bacterium]
MEERTSFSAYYNQYKHKVFSFFFYRLNGDRATAEDLTGDVFVKAYEHFDSFDHSKKFYSWIFAIVRNTLIDYFRTRKNYADLEDGLEVSDQNSEAFVRNVDNNMKIEKVHKVLSEIPAFQKECILLKFLGDMTTKEIALVTEKSEDNIRQSISRALSKLRARKELYFVLLLCISALL